MSKINDLELAVRTIEGILSEMPTKGLQKWKGILETALVKIEAELLNTTQEHVCGVCLSKEFGYRTELPVGWREKGDLTICFNHEDNEVADLLKKALDADKPEPVNTEKTLDELYAMI